MDFTKKTWSDTSTSGTVITSSDLNKYDNTLSFLNEFKDYSTQIDTHSYGFIAQGMYMYSIGNTINIDVNVECNVGTKIELNKIFLKIPYDIAPLHNLYIACIFFASDNYPMIGWCDLDPNGSMRVINYIQGNSTYEPSQIRCHVSYIRNIG